MDTVEKSRVLFVLASVGFIFTLIWALIGENNLKMLAVFVGYACFLYRGIDYEMNIRAQNTHH